MKKLASFAAVCVLASTCAQAVQFNWYPTGVGGLGVFGPNGNWSVGDTWSIRMYLNDDSVLPTSFDYNTWQPNDGGSMLSYQMVPGQSFLPGDGTLYWFDSPDTAVLGLNVNSYVYTVVWNRSTVGFDQNTAYSILPNSGVQIGTLWDGDPQSFGWNYDVGGNAQGNWVMVPEPASMALFGLGLAAVAVRRALKK